MSYSDVQVALRVERKGLLATKLTSTRKLLHHAVRAKLPEMCSGYFGDQRLELSKKPLETVLRIKLGAQNRSCPLPRKRHLKRVEVIKESCRKLQVVNRSDNLHLQAVGNETYPNRSCPSLDKLHLQLLQVSRIFTSKNSETLQANGYSA